MNDIVVNAKITIKNAPERLYRWNVVRICDNGLWYYGTYKDHDRAKHAADEIYNGMLIEVEVA